MTKTAKVNGERIRALRSNRGLSQKQLAGKVKVDPGTVSRWERGEINRIRHDVLGRMRLALNATEADICAEGPLPESDGGQQVSPKGQMNLSIDPACRNALALVAQRYRVRRQQIVEAAPLLFFIAAEQSLQQRRNRLRELRGAADALVAATPPHLPPHWPVDDTALEAEEQSIGARDLFGTMVGETAGEPDSWNRDEENPFAAFLNAALSGIDQSMEPVEFSEWWPIYKICPDDAPALVGDDP